MARIAVHHQTSYHYDRAVTASPQIIRLHPAAHATGDITAYSLTISPKKHFIHWFKDPLSNQCAKVTFPEKIDHFTVNIDMIVDVQPYNPFDFILELHHDSYPFDYDVDLQAQLFPYLQRTEAGEALNQLISQFSIPCDSVLERLIEINQTLHQMINYQVRLEPGIQDCEKTLTKKTGSCRDIAWLLCVLLRQLGFAARFASGYLLQLVHPEDPGIKKDILELHAWTEVYLPGSGWVGFDPTSGFAAAEGYIPLCCAAKPELASPISGALESCETEFDFKMTLERLDPPKKIAQPIHEPEFEEINRLGHELDRRIAGQGCALTMGGEPTFVSKSNRNDPQWMTAADGEEKRKKAVDLLYRLAERYGSDGMFQYGLGKHYPGEEVPRWCYRYIWYRDGKPLWTNRGSLARPDQPSKMDIEQAKIFIDTLSKKLNLSSHFVQALIESEVATPWQDQTKPTERLHAAKVGYVLPLGFSTKVNHWVSNDWKCFNGEIKLLPGHLTTGFRLPLHLLPRVSERLIDPPNERSPFDLSHEFHKEHDSDPIQFSNALPDGAVRTALTVDIANGTMAVSLPPTSNFAHYQVLLNAIEQTSEATEIPVLLSGYFPPSDPSIVSLSVTPDPGVLEVNLHPSMTWEEQREMMDILFEEAEACDLTTEKYMLDGRVIGTGGGHHITLGGLQPSESPFLNRPDLLQSFITFWQHHPSLSYLFSGLFIGPTSQAPRIDEARHESLYELEIAFKQIQQQPHNSPWSTDRLLRHLLVDVTGNNHRSEFCIDKLYSPDSESGRQGLVEFRAFDMPPHRDMCKLQLLLIKGLFSYFLVNPYQRPLIRWGNTLHDTYMLPHYLWTDFKEVLSTLNQANIPLREAWYESFRDFRFPVYGKVNVESIELTLQMALEPWPVLGEEVFSGQTSRGVDSATERVQVMVQHFDPARYAILCNGHQVPLQRTQGPNQWIAGVRFKAWPNPITLHPNLPVDNPLVFDIVDRQRQRSIGGCRYYVYHPDGRHFDQLPMNSKEADARRHARFQPFGHTPGTLTIPDIQLNPEFPCTLDLRLY